MKLLGYEVNKASGKTKKGPNNPIGFYGLRQNSGIVTEEFIQNLQWPNCAKIYLEMSSNDAVVGACLYMLETLIRKATWSVKPASSDPGDIENAKFVKSCMDDLDETWDSFISEALSMLTYGFSMHEILYKVRRGPEEKDEKFRSAFSDGKIGWRGFPVRAQTTLKEWTFDDSTGRPIEFVQDPSQVGAMGQVVNIPLDGNLLFKMPAGRNNPEGRSVLRRAYRSWYFKKYIEELEGIGIERSLAGIPVMQPDENTPLFDPDNEDMKKLMAWAQDLLDGLRQDKNHGVIIPFGWTLKLMGGESKSALDPDVAIRRYESRMAMAMLADVVLIGGDRTGSFALASVKQDLLTSALQCIVNNICGELNRVAVRQLFILNGMPTDKLPIIETNKLASTTVSEVALLLRSMNVNVTKSPEFFNFLMRLIDAPQDLTPDVISQLSNVVPAAVDPGNPDDPEGGPTNSEGSEDDLQDSVDNKQKQSDLSYT